MNEEEQQEEQQAEPITIMPPTTQLDITQAGEDRRAEAIAAAERAGGRVGAAARGLFEDVGEKLESQGEQPDNLSDLFEGPDMERDNDVYIKDLVTVDDEDVLGEGGEEGIDEVLEVSEEDVMGEEPAEKRQVKQKRTAPRQQPLPKGLTGLRI